MQTAILSESGLVEIPALIRKKMGLKAGDNFTVHEESGAVRLVLKRRANALQDPIRALRGIGKGEGLNRKLLTERRKEATL